MSDETTPQPFKLHQMVQLVRAPVPTARGMVAPSEYEIIRVMPADANGELSYRVRAGQSELSVRAYEIKA